MKKLFLVIENIEDDTKFGKEFYDDILRLVKGKDERVSQILIETKSKVIYCYGENKLIEPLIA